MTTCRHSFCADCKRSLAVAVPRVVALVAVRARRLLNWLLRRLLYKTDPFTRSTVVIAIKPTIPANCKVVLRFGA